ncbi:MAG: hypothetical protein O3B24_09105 [Verrucomicrobia bacterium]|nr:hypothetical protein [Verrucomicrobiota bacterium]
MRPTQTWWRFLTPTRVAFGWIALGVILRLRQYLFCRSLWIDEANLANNILARGWGGLLAPLDGDQAAPPGFLLAAKLVTVLCGGSEYALRLLPFLAGILLLFAFYALARRCLKPWTVAAVMAVVATNWQLIRYMNECKQYAGDALATVLILLMAERHTRGRINFWPMILGGIVLPWFSHPSALVLGGVGGCLIVQQLVLRNWRAAGRWGACCAAWLVSFAGLYVVSIAPARANDYLQRYWAEGYPPEPWLTPAGLAWFRDAFWAFVKMGFKESGADDLLGWLVSGLLALAVVAAIVSVLIPGRRWLVCMLAPLPLALLAAMLQLYPFSHRLLVYLVPIAILVVASGVELLPQRGLRVMGALLLWGILLLRPLQAQLANFRSPMQGEETRPLLNVLRERRAPGEPMYVYYSAQPAVRYYAPRCGFSTNDFMMGVMARGAPEAYLRELEMLLGGGRAWFLFSHDCDGEERFITRSLAAHGPCLTRMQETGAALYLFDLSPAPEP